MKEAITERFTELINQGNELIKHIPVKQYWVGEGVIPDYQAWLSSVSHLLRTVARKGSHYFDETKRLITHKDMNQGIPCHIVRKMLGLLTSAQGEWSKGMLREIEYIVAAETFDDFLDHAAWYHKGNKKTEASVLASTVLEDTIKRVARKNSLETKGKKLEQLIDDLIKAEVFTPVKGKRIKAYTGTRNNALHAEWDKFDIKDVGEMIKGIRELLEDFL